MLGTHNHKSWLCIRLRMLPRHSSLLVPHLCHPRPFRDSHAHHLPSLATMPQLVHLRCVRMELCQPIDEGIYFEQRMVIQVISGIFE
jgi:hypothetical protein